MSRFAIILLFLLSFTFKVYAQKTAVDTFTTAEWQKLYTTYYHNSTFANYFLADSFSREGDSINASVALMKVSPYHLFYETPYTPQNIDSFIQSKFRVTSQARRTFVTQFTKAYNTPRSATYTQFKNMHDEDQRMRSLIDSCSMYNNCKAVRKAMLFSDSTRADYLLRHLRKKGWPSLEDGSLYACVIAIHDHNNHHYYDSALYRASLEGKTPLDVLLLIETWKERSFDFEKLLEHLKDKAYAKILLADLGELKGLGDSSKAQIKRELKRLCPVKYYFTCESDSSEKREAWGERHYSFGSLKDEQVLSLAQTYIVANTCYTSGKHETIDKDNEYFGLSEVQYANKIDREGVYVYLVSIKPKDTIAIAKRITDTFSVFFDRDENTLDIAQQIALQSILSDSLLVTDTLRIVGLADNTGEDKNNKKLSEQRAKNIRDYLVGNGIDQDHIVNYIGVGAVIRETKSIEVAEDRRVDIIVQRREKEK